MHLGSKSSNFAESELNKSGAQPLSLRINTNIQAQTSLRSLNNVTNMLSTSMERLSTGLRINSAADDPAGLVISESMRTQILGIDQATRNAQDAINMTKTAEAALGEVQTLLRSLRATAVHSANTATIDNVQLQANQAQVRNVVQSINRIAEQTQWGNKRLLDGTAGAVSNVTRPNDVSSIFIGGTFKGESVGSGPITVAKVTAAERASVTLGNTFGSLSSIVTNAGSFVINGYSFTSDGNESVGTLLAKINARSQTTGVIATTEIVSGNLAVKLSTTDFGADKHIDFFDPTNIIHNASSASDTGVNAVYNVSLNTSAGLQTDVFTGGQAAGSSGLYLTDSYGNSITMSESGNSGLGSPTQIGVQTAGGVQFQLGAMANQAISFSMPNVFANRLGTGVVASQDLSTLDITTTTGSQNAIRIVDAAVVQLAQWRGDLGAFQSNYLESTVRSLAVAKENLSASESAIRDVDMAEEMTNFTKYQILQQSGLSMVAQANQSMKGILSLLQGG